MTPYKIADTGFGVDDFDLIIATDLRFPGGSTHSTLEEALACCSRGWKTGFFHMPARMMDRRLKFNPAIAKALNNSTAYLVNPLEGSVRTKVLLFRHPAILNVDGDPLPDIEADHVLLVVNHPPVRPGRIDYLLTQGIRKIREKYGCEPKVFPIGPVIRQALEVTYDNALKFEPGDWSNVFDIERFGCKRDMVQRRKMVIGRHSRPAWEKWPDTAEDIQAAYPSHPDIEVRILGGAKAPVAILGRRPANWKVYEFGSKPVEEFLREIDVFVYFHHPDWIEAFGRVIVEAMASGLPTILPPHFESLFGDSVIYCTPDGVLDAIDMLRDADTYRLYSTKALRYASDNFGHEVHFARMRRLGLADDGGRSGSAMRPDSEVPMARPSDNQRLSA